MSDLHNPKHPVSFFSVSVVLGLHCCVGAFSSGGEQGLLFVVVCELLIVMSSLAVDHKL